ncbi:MAG: hypothetical protein IIA44_02540, partial [Acidobacteria bacterium]|nr:hypothetical protein [Acidobacteriota bacterium]
MTHQTKVELSDGEQILTVAASVIAVAFLLVWTAGQLTGRLWAGQWPDASLLDSPHILVRLITHPGDPASAWPNEAVALIPGPAAYYPVLVFLTLTTAFIAGYGWHLWQRDTRKDD